MEHKEYKRIVDVASVAVLFIHGIAGTPDHFDRFIPLVPGGISVYNMLLDGHGKTVRDFSRTSMKKWESQVSEAVTKLAETHEKIYIVAHSMGSLFAIDQAIHHSKVQGLFLLAAPIKLFIKPRMVQNSFKVYRNKIKPDDAEGLAAKACYGISPDKNPFHYIGWIPRYMELFAKIKRTQKSLSELSAPCSIFLSKKDEMVSVRSVKYFKKNPNIKVDCLDNSTHYYYTSDDLKVLSDAFELFMDNAFNK